MVAIFFIGDSVNNSRHAANGLPYFQAVSHFDSGQYGFAVDELSEAIRLRSDDTEAYLLRGRAYNELGQYQRALGDFDKAVV